MGLFFLRAIMPRKSVDGLKQTNKLTRPVPTQSVELGDVVTCQSAKTVKHSGPDLSCVGSW